MMRGALHRLKTLPFRRSTRFSHFRSNPQIFDTGFSRLFPSYFSPSHHSPRSFPGHPDRAPRSARFSALYAQLEKPVKEAAPNKQRLLFHSLMGVYLHGVSNRIKRADSTHCCFHLVRFPNARRFNLSRDTVDCQIINIPISIYTKI